MKSSFIESLAAQPQQSIFETSKSSMFIGCIPKMESNVLGMAYQPKQSTFEAVNKSSIFMGSFPRVEKNFLGMAYQPKQSIFEAVSKSSMIMGSFPRVEKNFLGMAYQSKHSFFEAASKISMFTTYPPRVDKYFTDSAYQPKQSIFEAVSKSSMFMGSFPRVEKNFLSMAYQPKQSTLEVTSSNSIFSKIFQRELNSSSLHANRSLIPDNVVNSVFDAVILSEGNSSTGLSIQSLIVKLNPDLSRMWMGANQALESNSVERNRHFAVSLREFINNMLRELSPNDLLLNWIDGNDRYFSNGKPTREARLHFIYRNISDDKFKAILQKDISATIELINFLNRIVHGVFLEISDLQVQYLKSRSEEFIKRVLLIYFNGTGQYSC